MANTSGSKIEASNKDFDTLMKALYAFLNDSNRQNGIGNSAINQYSFSGQSDLPHEITDGQSVSQDDIITKSYASSLNVIYDILKNNYMKTGEKSVTIINNIQYSTTDTIIPALEEYQNLIDYWKNGGANVCNGACTGYCSGSCANTANSANSQGTNCICTGCTQTCYGGCGLSCKGNCGGCTSWCKAVSQQDNVPAPSGCNATCTSYCGGQCGGNCADSCSSYCGNGCTATCSINCSNNCIDTCKDKCTGGCTACTGSCDTACAKGCTNGCGVQCSGSCMFGATAKPI